MKRLKSIILALIVATALVSCSNKEDVGRKYAEETSMLFKSNFSNLEGITMMNAALKLKNVPPSKDQIDKFKVILTNLEQEVIKEQDKEAKKQIIKGYLKGLIDSDCMNSVLTAYAELGITYDNIKSFEWLLSFM